MDLMNAHSHILCCGLTQDNLVLPYFPLMLKQISIHGCLTSTPGEIAYMLDFAAEKGVRPIVEEFPMTEEGATHAIEKLVTGKIRYRGVLNAEV
jgi:D-arabinose 1-dehydrogenase-like Zn-dependent alcohol dehydrogenase